MSWPASVERFLQEQQNEFDFHLIKAFQFGSEYTREALFRLFRLFEIITSKFKGESQQKYRGGG